MRNEVGGGSADEFESWRRVIDIATEFVVEKLRCWYCAYSRKLLRKYLLNHEVRVSGSAADIAVLLCISCGSTGGRID